MSDEAIRVYGADSCKDTWTARRHLEKLGASYTYIDIDRNTQAAALVERLNEGARRTPTILLEDRDDDCEHERVLRNPSETELDAALDRARLLPLEGRGDGSPGLENPG